MIKQEAETPITPKTVPTEVISIPSDEVLAEDIQNGSFLVQQRNCSDTTTYNVHSSQAGLRNFATQDSRNLANSVQFRSDEGHEALVAEQEEDPDELEFFVAFRVQSPESLEGLIRLEGIQNQKSNGEIRITYRETSLL